MLLHCVLYVHTRCKYNNRLLSLVGAQQTIRVVDVTHDSHGLVVQRDPALEEEGLAAPGSKAGAALVVALPKELKQFEVRLPAEDKDTYIYYYLHKVSSLFLSPPQERLVL